MNGFPEVLPLDMMLAGKLERAQRESGHYAPMATHAILRRGEVIGAFSACAPLMTFFADPEKLRGRECWEMVNFAKNSCKEFARQVERRAGRSMIGEYLMACSVDSPFHPMMGEIGGRLLGTVDIFEGK